MADGTMASSERVEKTASRQKSKASSGQHGQFPRQGGGIEDIYEGEEIFAHYQYPIKADVYVPLWYKQLYKKTFF